MLILEMILFIVRTINLDAAVDDAKKLHNIPQNAPVSSAVYKEAEKTAKQKTN